MGGAGRTKGSTVDVHLGPEAAPGSTQSCCPGAQFMNVRISKKQPRQLSHRKYQSSANKVHEQSAAWFPLSEKSSKCAALLWVSAPSVLGLVLWHGWGARKWGRARRSRSLPSGQPELSTCSSNMETRILEPFFMGNVPLITSSSISLFPPGAYISQLML